MVFPLQSLTFPKFLVSGAWTRQWRLAWLPALFGTNGHQHPAICFRHGTTWPPLRCIHSKWPIFRVFFFKSGAIRISNQTTTDVFIYLIVVEGDKCNTGDTSVVLHLKQPCSRDILHDFNDILMVRMIRKTTTIPGISDQQTWCYNL